MRYTLLIFLIVTLFTSCSTKDPLPTLDFFENDAISLKTKLKKVLEDDYLTSLGFNKEESKWLQEVYAKNNFKTRWVNDSMLTKYGLELKKTLANSIWFGIPQKRIHLAKKKNLLWIEEEVILTAQSGAMMHDLNYGFIDLEKKKLLPRKLVRPGYLDSCFAEKDSLTYDQIFLKRGIADTNYRFLATKLYYYCAKTKMDTSHFDIEPIKKDSLHAFEKTRKALISKGFIDKKIKDSISIVEGLKAFQEMNGLKPDGKIGKYTTIALNESTVDKVLRAGLSLEKIRRHAKYPEKYIRINLPEYKLRYFVNDSLKREHNVVVGKTENQTPELTSKVYAIVVYPFWTVPQSICNKEILPAARGGAGYFARNNYKIYRGDKEVDPYSVNWKRIPENSFPYKVVQQPGTRNSLGIIKFEFHNSHSVYVHDTPSKSLFGTDVRSYSHGCMRCKDPVDLGKTVLDYDSIRKKRNDITSDSLDSLLSVAKNYTIRLKDPVPIFVEYQTVFADREVLIFYLDIYKRDEEYLKIMRD
jgi:hypothetical protein